MENKLADPFDDAIDFQKLFSALLRWMWLFALCALLGAGGAYYFSARQTPVYEAVTNILVSRSSQQQVQDISQSLNITQLVETYSRMLSMKEFLDVVSQKENHQINPDNVLVKALPNTQVIELRVRDEDPARAARIADAMVVALAERNETLQAGRYNESERALVAQVQNTEARITEIQAKLDAARQEELAKQIAQVQANINVTVETIKTLTLELERLDKMSWEEAHFSLLSTQRNLVGRQSVLDQHVAEKEKRVQWLSSERAQKDPNYANLLRAQIEMYDRKIAEANGAIEDLQKEIAFLAPLDGEKEFDAAVVKKQNDLSTQEALLKSYQELYASLLSTEEVARATNEMKNLQNNLDLYQKIYVNLQSQLEDVRKEKMQNTPTVEQVSSAVVSEKPVSPRTLLNTGLGGLAGIILAAAFVVIRELADETVKSGDEVREILGARTLGYFVDMKNETDGQGIYVNRFPRSPIAEEFRSLRARLGLSKSATPVKSIVVTSVGPGEGKTTIAANLAAVLAHAGKKVVLVDADLRRPRLHKYIGMSNQAGLADLANAEDVEAALARIQPMETLPNLGVLPSGGTSDSPADLMSSPKMGELIKTLAGRYDYVVLDAPPMLVADPQVLLGFVDGVLLVMIPGKTRLNALRSVSEALKETGVKILGVVFNRLKHGRGAGGYGYYAYPYYYASEYYYSENPETGAREKRRKNKIGADEGKIGG